MSLSHSRLALSASRILHGVECHQHYGGVPLPPSHAQGTLSHELSTGLGAGLARPLRDQRLTSSAILPPSDSMRSQPTTPRASAEGSWGTSGGAVLSSEQRHGRGLSRGSSGEHDYSEGFTAHRGGAFEILRTAPVSATSAAATGHHLVSRNTSVRNKGVPGCVMTPVRLAFPYCVTDTTTHEKIS